MNGARKRLFGLIAILVLASTLTGVIASFIFYSTALAQKSQFLLTEVLNLSRLIEAVAKFDRHTFRNVDRATVATLSQVEAAFKDQKGIGATGEVMMGRREAGKTVIFLRYRDNAINQNLILPYDSTRSEAMTLALSGKTGVGQFIDLSGERVLAAYTFVPYLQTGLEIKVAMSEIIAPYIYSAVMIAAASGAIIFVGIFLFLRITRPVLNEIRRLTHRMIEIKDEEQDNISKELHDTIGTNLVWLKLQAQQILAGLPEKKTESEALMRSFDETVDIARNLSTNLSPVAIEKLSLPVMLERLVERASRLTKARIHIAQKNTHVEFPARERFHIFRIVQEILNNALKHSSAEHINVYAGAEGNKFKIRVKDDGAGFDSASRSDGLGLSLIAERAKLLKGKITVSSRRGKGTEVTVEFPVR